MSVATASLWSSQIRPGVRSPATILQEQATALTHQTSGLLVGEVVESDLDNDRLSVTLDIVVPALNDYRHRVLRVTHHRVMVYPAKIDAAVFREAPVEYFAVARGSARVKAPNEADSDTEFYELVEKALKYPSVVAVATSLIARASELRPPDAKASPPSGDSAKR